MAEKTQLDPAEMLEDVLKGIHAMMREFDRDFLFAYLGSNSLKISLEETGELSFIHHSEQAHRPDEVKSEQLPELLFLYADQIWTVFKEWEAEREAEIEQHNRRVQALRRLAAASSSA